ncbi:MAG: RNA chaperone Hfq [Oscillospiraceae bacterium]|jgi:host factor-I protein|nr:RNA chaperone Hfq [Oscillospiraceae bacterium]
MTGIQGLQENFLNQARSGKLMLTVFLVNGFQLRGTVTGFDTFTVVLDSEGKQQLIYKHAISTIIPIRPIPLEPEAETGTETETEQAAYTEQ